MFVFQKTVWIKLPPQMRFQPGSSHIFIEFSLLYFTTFSEHKIYWITDILNLNQNLTWSPFSVNTKLSKKPTTSNQKFSQVISPDTQPGHTGNVMYWCIWKILASIVIEINIHFRSCRPALILCCEFQPK